METKTSFTWHSDHNAISRTPTTFCYQTWLVNTHFAIRLDFAILKVCNMYPTLQQRACILAHAHLWQGCPRLTMREVGDRRTIGERIRDFNTSKKKPWKHWSKPIFWKKNCSLRIRSNSRMFGPTELPCRTNCVCKPAGRKQKSSVLSFLDDADAASVPSSNTVLATVRMRTCKTLLIISSSCYLRTCYPMLGELCQIWQPVAAFVRVWVSFSLTLFCKFQCFALNRNIVRAKLWKLIFAL